MESLTNELRELSAGDPDMALVLGTFEEIDRVYREVLEATGEMREPVLEAANSAKVMVSFRPSVSSCAN